MKCGSPVDAVGGTYHRSDQYEGHALEQTPAKQWNVRRTTRTWIFNKSKTFFSPSDPLNNHLTIFCCFLVKLQQTLVAGFSIKFTTIGDNYIPCPTGQVASTNTNIMKFDAPPMKYENRTMVRWLRGSAGPFSVPIIPSESDHNLHKCIRGKATLVFYYSASARSKNQHRKLPQHVIVTTLSPILHWDMRLITVTLLSIYFRTARRRIVDRQLQQHGKRVTKKWSNMSMWHQNWAGKEYFCFFFTCLKQYVKKTCARKHSGLIYECLLALHFFVYLCEIVRLKNIDLKSWLYGITPPGERDLRSSAAERLTKCWSESIGIVEKERKSGFRLNYIL